MNHQTDRSTAKIIVEGHPDLVEAITETMRHIFTVTYQSKDQHIETTAYVRRSLRILPSSPLAASGEGVGEGQ